MGEISFRLIDFCKNYEELCVVKYPDAPLRLEILKSTGSWLTDKSLGLNILGL